MQSGVFRQIDFAHAAPAQGGYDFVRTKSRAFSDRHIANCRAGSEWLFETATFYLHSNWETMLHVRWQEGAVSGFNEVQTSGAPEGIRTMNKQIMRRF